MPLLLSFIFLSLLLFHSLSSLLSSTNLFDIVFSLTESTSKKTPKKVQARVLGKTPRKTPGKTPKKSWADVLKRGLMARKMPSSKAERAREVIQKARVLRDSRKAGGVKSASNTKFSLVRLWIHKSFVIMLTYFGVCFINSVL